MKRHQNNTKTFDELTCKEKGQSVNAQFIIIERAMTNRINEAADNGKDPNELRTKYINRLNKIINNL